MALALAAIVMVHGACRRGTRDDDKLPGQRLPRATRDRDLPAPEPRPHAPPTLEERLLRSLNASRAEHGLPEVTPEPGLSALAEAHAARMANQGAIFHQRGNPPAGRMAGAWSGFAENVAKAPSPEAANEAFLHSPPHRSALLGQYTDVGVGVVEGRDGAVWVTVIFARE